MRLPIAPKRIVPLHYAGVACEMDTIMEIADRHGLYVVEDAAQGMHAYYKGCALGSIGQVGAYSYHETKNQELCLRRGWHTLNQSSRTANMG